MSTALRRMRERCMAVIAAQTFCPAAALLTASSTSAWLARCRVARTSSVGRIDRLEGAAAAGCHIAAANIELLFAESGHGEFLVCDGRREPLGAGRRWRQL